MEKDIFEWYENKAKSLNVDPDDVLLRGKLARTIYCPHDHILFEGMTFYRKVPHSKDYKFLINLEPKSPFAREIKAKDNELSTISELVGEKKYRALKFLTAKHFVAEEGLRYYVLSPDLLTGDFQSYSYFDLVTGNRMQSFVNPTQSTVAHDFSSVLKEKNSYLEYMTEHCYEQYVRFIMNGIFEFSDDDSLANVILVKHKNSAKFEDIFVCDKESTAFNFMLCSGMSYKDIVKALKRYDHYMGVVVAELGKDNIMVRLDKIKKLFDRGVMSDFHLNLLKEIAGIDYDKIFQQALQNSSLKGDKRQLDFYKYGSELAEDLVKTLE